MAKLPTFDNDWAKSQYIWGLNQRVAELVVIAEPTDLQAAILKAEKWKWPEERYPAIKASPLEDGSEEAEEGSLVVEEDSQ